MTTTVAPRETGLGPLRWGWFSWWFLALFLVLNTATPVDWSYSVTSLDASNLAARMALLENGNIYRRIGVPLLLLLAAMAWRYGKRPAVVVRGMLPLAGVAFLVVAYASVTWSADFDFVLRKLIVLTMLLISSAVLAYHFSVFDLVKFCVLSGVVIVLMGLGAEVAYRSFQPWLSTYRFSGIMHPNAMASNCGIAFLGAVAWARRDPQRRGVLIAIALFMLVFLFLTKSRTAFGAAVIAGSLFWGISASRARITMVFLAAGMLLCAGVTIGSEDLIEPIRDAVLMGRGDEAATGTLSNRIPLWQECFEYIEDRPLTGYGYQSFWTPERTADVAAHQGWVMAHSHNEFIEMALGVGLVGAFFYAFVMVGSTVKALSIARRTADADWAFLACVMVFWVLNLLLEVGGLVPATAPFIALVVMLRIIAPPREALRIAPVSRPVAAHAAWVAGASSPNY